MNTRNLDRSTAPRGRFDYHGDAPEEGGVRAARSQTAMGAHPAPLGVPGPEERRLDISELLRNVGMQYTHRFQIAAGREEEYESVAPVEGEVTLTNTGALLLLRGEAKTVLRLECGRCLAHTDQPVETELSEEFDLVSANNAFRQEEVQAVDDNAGGSVITGGGIILDLGELLRQNLLLAAPTKPLCREECPGPIPGMIQPEEAGAEPTPQDNPLRHLAEMLEAKRRAEVG